ncbi:hemerythrin domain-containing protein [Streptomyces sp. SLBN-31]|uniref:hemerythrin domain-containing protein n=1 Tax=Streptomyces sp. SLBN-31 TaxID=2768444 RepID=UPI0011528129|nr:hemerythrin domain-containing protein [Streptomyces sp. SLBN-31]
MAPAGPDHGGSGTPEPDTGTQRRLARRLVALQSAHEFAEEIVLWPAVLRHCPAGDALVTTALEQERQLKRTLEELAHISPGSQEFTQCVNTLAGLNRTHLTYEENQVWPRLQDGLTARDTVRLARQWSGARRRAPTRPHPRLAARPVVLGTVGLAVAVVDRTRDGLTAR